MRRKDRSGPGDGRRRRGDAGISTLEYLGIVTTAAVLVGGILTVAFVYPEEIRSAVCRLEAAVVGGAAASCGPEGRPVPVTAPQDADFHPGACVLSETKDKFSAGVAIGVLKVGHEYGFIVQESSDGSVRATMTDGTGLEWSRGLGSKTFETDKLGDGDKIKTEVKVGAGLTYEYGSTWQFEDMDEFDAMREQLDAYVDEQHELRSGTYWGLAKGIVLEMTGSKREPPKDPRIGYHKIGIEAALKAGAGVRFTGSGTDAKGDPELIDPKMGVNGSLTAGGTVIVKEDAESGTLSYTYELNGKAELGGGMVVGHATGQGAVSGAFTTTYDEDGLLAEIAFKSSYAIGATGTVGNDTFKILNGKMSENESRSVVTTTKLAVTDANRSLVEDWIGGHAKQRTLSLPFSAFVPESPSSDPFMQLMYEEAKLSQTTYDNVKDTQGFGMAIKKGWELGFNVSQEDSTATKTQGRFLGAPTQDGTRQLVEDEKCM